MFEYLLFAIGKFLDLFSQSYSSLNIAKALHRNSYHLVYNKA